MNINITVVIQIINFFITYKVLNAFLFKPAITSLETKQKKKETLQNQITEQEQELVVIEKEKIASIISFQKHVKQTYPFIPPHVLEKPLELDLEPPTEEKKAADDAQREKQITDWLVTKVPHGY